MSLQCDNLSGELQDQWSSSFVHVNQVVKTKLSIRHEADLSLFLCIQKAATVRAWCDEIADFIMN